MASLQFKRFGGVTLHHWAGLGDGHYQTSDLVNKIVQSDSMLECRERIKTCDCLIIDEIGMLSAQVFEQFYTVCQRVRNSLQPFGNMQVIVAGSFRQLAPVPDYSTGDSGDFCFQAEHFTVGFPHHVHLNFVMRQNEPDLIKSINELCNGEPSMNALN